jgi:hypothetical protein
MGISDADVPGSDLTPEQAETFKRLQEARAQRKRAEDAAKMRIELEALQKRQAK